MPLNLKHRARTVRIDTRFDPPGRALATVDIARRALNEVGLYPYQIEGARWMLERAREPFALCDEQGVGKTAQLLRANLGRPLIVVCPSSLRLYWRDQIGRWMPSTRVHLPDPNELVIPGPDEVTLLSWDSIPTPLPGIRGIRIAFDEAQFGRGGDTNRALAAKALAKASGRGAVLTGTPMAGTPEDLWQVLDLVGLAEKAFGSRERYIEAWGSTLGEHGREWPEEALAPAWIAERLRTVMLRRLLRDVRPQLPSIEYEIIRVPVPEADEEELDLLDAAWEAIDADAPIPFHLHSAVSARLADSRIDDVLEYLDTRDEPIVLFAMHIGPIEALAGREGWATVTGERTTITLPGHETEERTDEEGRARAIRLFQTGRLPGGIAVTMQVAGTGLTLTHASHVVRVSRSYVPSENEQAVSRVLRIGQEAKGILVTDFVSDHSLEDRLLEVCLEKSARIRATVDAAAVRPEKNRSKARAEQAGSRRRGPAKDRTAPKKPRSR